MKPSEPAQQKASSQDDQLLSFGDEDLSDTEVSEFDYNETDDIGGNSHFSVFSSPLAMFGDIKPK